MSRLQVLAALGGRRLKGRKVAIQPTGTSNGVHACNVLILGPANCEHYGGKSVPTIADDNGIRRDGSVIAPGMEDGRIVFDVDIRAARQAGLMPGSKLLPLARPAQ